LCCFFLCLQEGNINDRIKKYKNKECGRTDKQGLKGKRPLMRAALTSEQLYWTQLFSLAGERRRNNGVSKVGERDIILVGQEIAYNSINCRGRAESACHLHWPTPLKVKFLHPCRIGG
jgi:hypothetical protein